jgi:hypothetical protein
MLSDSNEPAILGTLVAVCGEAGRMGIPEERKWWSRLPTGRVQ